MCWKVLGASRVTCSETRCPIPMDSTCSRSKVNLTGARSPGSATDELLALGADGAALLGPA